MKVIISPSKKMNIVDSNINLSTPNFFSETEDLVKELIKYSPYQIEELMHVNEKIAMDTFINYGDFFNATHSSPAIFSYNGLQYKHINPKAFSSEELVRLNNTIYIVSALYGLLKPFDKVFPYRLEMQCKLKIDDKNNMYQFWSDKLYNYLYKDTDIVLNLASKEYSKVISSHVKEYDRFITCDFKTLYKGKFRTLPAMAKILRGEMVRYICKNNINTLNEIKDFSYEGYHYSKEYSNEDIYTFIKI